MIFSAAGYDVQCVEEREELSPDTSRNSSLSLCGEMSPHHYGARETCSLTTDQWDTRLYCGVLAYDELGNRGQTSNIVQVDIPSRPSTAAPALEEEEEEVDTHTQELIKIIRLGNYSHIQELIDGINSGNSDRANTTNNIYIATGVMAGIVAVIVLLLLVMIYRNRRKQKLVSEPVITSTFPVSDIRVRQQASESPTLIHSSKLSSTDGSSKVLLSWLEDLPTSRSPHRQRMLTNGSFVKLQESSSECGSTQHTMSTLDETRAEDSQTAGSDSSGSSEFYNNNYACSVRRSATLYSQLAASKTATLNRRQYSRNNQARLNSSTPGYSSATLGRLPRTSTTVRPRTELGSATLGRRPRHWEATGGSCEDIIGRGSSHHHLPSHLSETDLYYGYRQGRKVKRTESFV